MVKFYIGAFFLLLVLSCGSNNFSKSQTGGPVTWENGDVEVPTSDDATTQNPPQQNPDSGDNSGMRVFNYTKPPIANGYTRNIQRGANLNAKALYSVLDNLKEDSCEKDIKESIHQIFKEGGSVGFSFNSIVASGPNALTLHYDSESRCLQQGEMIKIDIGSRINEYASDITRTFPANGVFSPRQREIYSLVLGAQQAVAAFIKPREHSLAQAHAFVRDFFKNSPLRAKDKNGQTRSMDYFFIHSLGHYIGKNVHGQDLGYSQFDPLMPGRAIAIEPGIYLPQENLGIRIEDDFLIGEDSVKSLNPNLIVEIDDIEAYMAGDLILEDQIKDDQTLALTR